MIEGVALKERDTRKGFIGNRCKFSEELGD